MGIESNSPQILALREAVERKYGGEPKVHGDFETLTENINNSIREFISVTTLERVWNYSSRGYETISLHTLNLLCRYAGFESWKSFCNWLNHSGIIDSSMFDVDSIRSEDLSEGDLVELGWMPNRKCVVKYLGNNFFRAVECENSTMQKGDTFQCLEFIIGLPAVMDNFHKKGDENEKPKRYVAGLAHGLCQLKKL